MPSLAELYETIGRAVNSLSGTLPLPTRALTTALFPPQRTSVMDPESTGYQEWADQLPAAQKPVGWQEQGLETPALSYEDLIGSGIPTKLASLVGKAAPAMAVGVIKKKGGAYLNPINPESLTQYVDSEMARRQQMGSVTASPGNVVWNNDFTRGGKQSPVSDIREASIGSAMARGDAATRERIEGLTKEELLEAVDKLGIRETIPPDYADPVLQWDRGFLRDNPRSIIARWPEPPDPESLKLNSNTEFYKGSAGEFMKQYVSDYLLPRGAEIGMFKDNPYATTHRWAMGPLLKYVMKDMGTAEDPIRSLAEQGAYHVMETKPFPITARLKALRKEQGFPAMGVAKSPEAKDWEARADSYFSPVSLSDLRAIAETAGYAFNDVYPRARPEFLKDLAERVGNSALLMPPGGKRNDWVWANDLNALGNNVKNFPEDVMGNWLMRRAPENTTVYVPTNISARTRTLQEGVPTGTGLTGGFRDTELSGLMRVIERGIRNGTIDPGSVQRGNFTVESAVREANKARLQKLEEIKKAGEYDVAIENPSGTKWVKLNRPGQFNKESNEMGHSVRGYEPNDKPGPGYGSTSRGFTGVKEGDVKLYSLRDDQGRPMSTVEMAQDPETGEWVLYQARGKFNRPLKDKEIQEVLRLVNDPRTPDIQRVHEDAFSIGFNSPPIHRPTVEGGWVRR